MSKAFAEQAVQTDDAISSSVLDTDYVDSTSLLSSEIHSPDTSEVILTETKRRVLSTKCFLPFQRPSGHVTTEARLVSLPETSPPARIKTDQDGKRVVSMTEYATRQPQSPASNSVSFNLMDNSGSLDDSMYLSPSSKRIHSPSSRSILRTPSAPSSPDSVMIIGNDHQQVPDNFLRVKVTASEDKDWPKWTDSPPRPIPALHGPLSLPYARCPSGAEGTVVQGEDLSRMIWGLDRPDPNDVADQQSPYPTDHHEPDFAEIRSQSAPFSRQTHHDVARSPILIPRAPAQTSNAFREPIGSRQFSTPHFDARTFSTSDLNPQAAYQDGQDWFPYDAAVEEQRHFQTFGGRSSLDPSPPLFMPSTKASQHSHFQSSRPSFSIPNEHRLHREYQSIHPAAQALLTPPSTVSPKWSSSFPNNSDLVSSDLAFDYQSREEDHYPSLAPGQTDELAELISRRVHDLNLSSRLSESDILRLLQGLSMNSGLQDEVPGLFPNPRSPVSPANSMSPPSAPPGLSGIRESLMSERRVAYPLSPPSPSHDFARSAATSRQPRSVPFARLMQRRLSAVPEEDVPSSVDPSERPDSRPRTSSNCGSKLKDSANVASKSAFEQSKSHSKPKAFFERNLSERTNASKVARTGNSSHRGQKENNSSLEFFRRRSSSSKERDSESERNYTSDPDSYKKRGNRQQKKEHASSRARVQT